MITGIARSVALLAVCCGRLHLPFLACIGLLGLLWPLSGAAQSLRTVTEGYEEQ